VGDETESGAAPEQIAERESQIAERESEDEFGALAIATDAGPVVVEIELEALDVRPLLQPTAAKIAAVEPVPGFWKRYRLFIFTVIMPMTIGAVLLLVVATPRYASTASFIVRSIGRPDPQTSLMLTSQLLSSSTSQLNSSSTQGGSSTGQLGSSSTQLSSSPMQLPTQLSTMMLPAMSPTLAQNPMSTGSAIAPDETFAVNAYLTSRDLVDQLVKNNELREILSRPEGDFLFRYPTFWLPDDAEFLYQRFGWMASAEVDEYTLVSTIEVNAFRPEDALALANAMLEGAEARVNKMNQRSYDDGLVAANRLVAEAQKEVDEASSELQAYRNASGSIDPNAVAQSKLTVIQGLSAQLAQVRATLAQQTALSPRSPTLAPLRAQAQSLHEEIEKRKLEIAGSSRAEADKLERYEQLTTRAQLAATALATAAGQRDQARQDVQLQHFFIQVIDRPKLSRGYARYPRTVLDLLVLLALCLATFYTIRKMYGLTSAYHA
jgi:capsular polysaccharide transport system permease protein